MRAPISSTLRWLVFLGFLLVSLLIGRNLAGAEPDDKGPVVAAGALSYRVYCASCHGIDADGRGPLAEVLRIPPPDLTTLSLRNGGDFPAARVAATIDGREEIRSHGRSDMPVWGIAFRESGRSGEGETEVRQRIRDLVEYLRTLQVGHDTKP